MDRLMLCLNIPSSVQDKIKKHSKDEVQQREECIYYWINVSPNSMIGWGVIGGWLHLWEEEAALRAAKLMNTFRGLQVHVCVACGCIGM